jgi:hypothetical protein
MLVGGIHLPKHFGQSGHPRPDPETRTNPPTKIKRYDRKVEIRADLKKSLFII